MTRSPAPTAADLRLIEAERVTPTRWRNGGGSTRELLVWPDPAGAAPSSAPWQLRVSLADISQHGQFSAYPGVERWFAVVSGAGVRLALPGAPVQLQADSPPLVFDGAHAPDCQLLDGPSRDLNLMLRRDAGQGSLQRALAAQRWQPAATMRGLFTSGAATLLVDGQPPRQLPAMSLLFTSRGDGQAWTLQPAAGAALQAWWLAFTPNAPVQPQP